LNHKDFTQKLKLLFILAFALLIGQSVIGQTIVGWTLATNSSSDSGISANVLSKLNNHGISGAYGGSQVSCYNWNSVGNDSWLTDAFSTANFINISVSFQLKTTDKTGLRDIQLEYSLNGTSWTNISGNITLTTSYGTGSYSYNLPQICENKAKIYLRWVQNSTYRMDGATPVPTNNTGSAQFKGVSVAGDLFTAPSTQASVISIVSVTPTTITISCTKGKGTNRIIKANTVNNFSDPLENSNPTGNSTYTNTSYTGNGIEQVVYNGTGTSVVINVPNSTNVYWFRVYDYNLMDALTRYNINIGSSGNPKLCSLENIHSPTYSNIGLINATLGATIDAPSKGSITERGIYWSYMENINPENNGFISNEFTSSAGTYAFPVIGGVSRGSIIYFKGYVTNESGTILSEESSFSNIPQFTGTGNWENPSLWNVKEVPGLKGNPTYGDQSDSPIINGNCTLNTTNTVNDLTINSGKSLILNTGNVNTGNCLNVVGTLINNAGNSGIIIKSAKGKVNGSLVWTDGNPAGTVEMYSKSFTDTKYHWQFFGIPVTGTTAGSTFGGTGVRVRRYNESNFDSSGQDVGLWLPSTPGGTMATTNDAMSPVAGYEVTQPNDAKNFIFTGILNHSDFIDYPLGYTLSANWTGNNIIANPYTAAIDISQIAFTNTEPNVYLYNAGSRDEWSSQSNNGATVDGTSAGQYTVSNGAFAGTLGTTSQIPSMQGFLVKAMGNNATISIPYSSVITNTTQQRAPGTSESILKVGTRIDVMGNNYSDKMWIFTDPVCTHKYDFGYDGPKLFGSALTPQLFSMEDDGNYQINAVNNMNETYLGFQAGSETNFKLIFNHQNTESKYGSIYLVDLMENKTVDITANGTEYGFTAITTPAPTKRFKIVTTPLIITPINLLQENSKLKIFSSKGSVFVQNFTRKAGNILLYNMAGVIVRDVPFNVEGITEFSNIAPGVYFAKAKCDMEEIRAQLIIR